MIKVDSVELEVVRRGGVGGRRRHAVGHDVLNAESFAAFVVGTFDLVGGSRTAPKKTVGKHSSPLVAYNQVNESREALVHVVAAESNPAFPPANGGGGHSCFAEHFPVVGQG